MCGIFGLVNKAGKKPGLECLEKALRHLSHRGPDGQGTFNDGPLGMAHCRLAVFDTSAAGRQPMTYGKHTLVFNGAIYNFPELRKELNRYGYRFQTKTDTEVLLAAYQHWGENCVHHFNGMWSFAIYNRKNKELFCSRDRFGIRPFYYWDHNNYFAFASEIKAFKAIPEFRPQLNKVRAYEFLALGWQNHTDQCMLEEIQQLPAGSSATFNLSNHRLEIKRYYAVKEHIPKLQSEPFESRKQHFHNLFLDAVRLRLRSDVPVALSLSGGMDSSSVLAAQRQLQPGKPLSCFAVGFPGTSFDETLFVNAMIEHSPSPLQSLSPSFEDIVSGMETTCRFHDEPIASAAVIAHFLMLRAISQKGYKVMLNGQGADEILGGYDKFYWPFFKELAKRRPWALPREIAGYLKKSPLTLSDAWLRLWKSHFRPAAPPSWLQYDFVPKPEQRFQRSLDQDVAACSNNLLREVGLPVLLQYEDRNAMAHGVESRLPFLDHRMVEYSLGLPAEDKIRYGGA